MEALTLGELTQIKPGAIIASGVLPNSPEGLYMVNSRVGDPLRWVAVKGYGYNDWSIHCYWEENGIEYALSQGEKVTSKEYIKRCVPCTDEVYNLYRR